MPTYGGNLSARALLSRLADEELGVSRAAVEISVDKQRPRNITAIDSPSTIPWAPILAQAKDQLSRLVDEALSGEIVTITRHGKPVVSLTPIAPAPLPLTKADIDEMRRRAEARSSLGGDSVTLVREMREEEP